MSETKTKIDAVRKHTPYSDDSALIVKVADALDSLAARQDAIEARVAGLEPKPEAPRAFRVGDRVRVVKVPHFANDDVKGRVGTISGPDFRWDWRVVFAEPDDAVYANSDELELLPAPAQEPSGDALVETLAKIKIAGPCARDALRAEVESLRAKRTFKTRKVTAADAAAYENEYLRSEYGCGNADIARAMNALGFRKVVKP